MWCGDPSKPNPPGWPVVSPYKTDLMQESLGKIGVQVTPNKVPGAN